MIKTLKPFIVSLAIVASIFWAFEAHAQTPITNQQRNIIPALDSQYYLGTTTGATGLRAWLRVIADSFYDTDASDGCAQWVSNVLTSTGSDCGTGSGGAGGGLGTTTPWTTGNLVRVVNNSSVTSIATSSLGLEVSSFLSPNISQWTNNSGYQTYPWPFTRLSTNEQATSTIISLLGGLTSASSTFTGAVTIVPMTSALLQTGAGGLIAEYSGTSCTNQFPRSLSALGIATCESVANTDLANSTISGVALGSNLNALTNGATLNGSSYNGSSAISDWDINLGNSNAWTALQTFTNATATNFSSTIASTSQLRVDGSLTFNGVTGSAWSTFCTAITGSAGLCDGDDATGAGGSSFAFPFTLQGSGSQATSTVMQFIGGFVSNASSTLTSFTATNATTSSFGVTGLTNCDTIDTDASGYFVCGTDASGAGGEPYPFPLATNATSSTVGFFGGLLSTASSTFTGSTTLATTLMTNATSTNLAVTSGFAVSGITSAIPLTNAVGEFAEYAGTSCTNQFVRSLSALGVATCATVGASDVSLANLTATDSTLTFSGTYNGSTARTIGLNLGNANSWTALQSFTNTDSILATGSTTLQNFTGRNATTTNFSVTSNSLMVGGNNHITATTTSGFRVASTTLDARGISFSTGTTSIQIATFPEARTLTSLYCVASSTGSVRYRIGDGTNWANTNSTSCSTTGARTYFTTTNTFTADETVVVEIGTSATSPSTVTLSPTWIKSAP